MNHSKMKKQSHGGPRKKFKNANTSPSNPARRMFTKLVKDDKAAIRNKRDVRRFIEGMDTYECKTELLSILEDKRFLGIRRIEDCLSMLEDISDIDFILAPLLRNIINDATTRPLYKRMFNKIVSAIFCVPELLEFLKKVDFASASSISSAQTVCSFLEVSAEILVEARNSDLIKDISQGLLQRGIKGSRKLCALLLVDTSASNASSSQKTKYYCNERLDAVACWVSDLTPPGGRHDNDFKNYRDIELVPTRQEIVCDEPPWLPLATGENAFIEDKEMRMLDSCFRLLREDSVSTMKSNISEQKRIWHNARIIDVCCTTNYKNHKGKSGMTSLSFLVQVDLPDRKKPINWGRSRVLAHGSVICFCKNGEVFKMGTISERRLEWLESDAVTIGVTFGVEQDFKSSLQEIVDNMLIVSKLKKCEMELEKIKSTKKKNQAEEKQLCDERRELIEQMSCYDLIEASTSFFSYKSTLQALKELISVPLSEELVFFTPSTQRPEYLPSKMLMPAKKFNSFECDLDEWTIERITAGTSLDESQANALRCALTQRVALIQGPPGTESYQKETIFLMS